MLKYIRGLILVAVILIANACVPPTHATSATVMITHIQAGGDGAALQELIILNNNSSEEVDVTDWCLENKNDVKISCFLSMSPTERLYLPPSGYATIGSMEYMNTLQLEALGMVYSATNRNSGDIVGSADVISLVDRSGMVVDSHSWTTTLAGGSVLMRMLDEAAMNYLDTDQASDWQVGTFQGLPTHSIMRREGFVDVCVNIEGMQTEVPSDLELMYGVFCLPPLPRLMITELLPNPNGSDVGNEFIELYNPNEMAVSLADYALQVGQLLENQFDFPTGLMIEPLSYMVFDNTAYSYSLLNSSSRVSLANLEGSILDEVPSYDSPKDNMAWALVDGTWQFTNQPTPGAENRGSLFPDIIQEYDAPQEGSFTPCEANQYRHPETNRCRLIVVATTPAPCEDGQYRSEETGRCRKVAVATEPVPCKEGQERNPETNRCRNIVAITKADYAVLGTQTSSNGSWYIWAAIGGLILVALGYAVWEWRYELRKLFTAIFAKFARKHK